ncbi:hypothetical protein BO83DRAFT_117123 [Aspergillus eucalypticola CBS 122712]|uniref:Uncharacterized protein n=1 Tax=Aspergillus eucalypticola (strain CBS 122712 / IBT 29274) TaxID=1448314 RepID=A0A317UWN8_ASPEC|nr:uncharacterized protein BO83DRAFT_117123 [Aspergillus eucalypticola CBS 122712]PWY65829.1 hypothetical protein BO83DRAFT_117123 [Aspergillus eucalypticola CBS 122712]
MSKDSTPTHLHMHHPRLADYFEDFTRPHHTSPSSSPYTSTTTQAFAATTAAAAAAAATGGGTGTSPTLTPSFLPIEDIYIPPQYQPPNPEDEDDVVPDQHAAFGIARAMALQGRRGEGAWRDLGLEGLVRGDGSGEAAGKVRVRGEGRLMGGRGGWFV